MKLWMKLAGMGLLMSAAAVCAVSAIGGIASAARSEPSLAAEFDYVPSCSLSEAEYVLREYEGCIAVFASVADTSPVSLTDIEVATLRDADRQILKTGLAVSNREELLTLLEDLGT